MMAAARSLGRSVSGGPAGVCVCVCVCAGSHAAAHRAMCALFSLRSARSDWLLVTLSSLRNSPSPPPAPPLAPSSPPAPSPPLGMIVCLIRSEMLLTFCSRNQ